MNARRTGVLRCLVLVPALEATCSALSDTAVEKFFTFLPGEAALPWRLWGVASGSRFVFLSCRLQRPVEPGTRASGCTPSQSRSPTW